MGLRAISDPPMTFRGVRIPINNAFDPSDTLYLDLWLPLKSYDGVPTDDDFIYDFSKVISDPTLVITSLILPILSPDDFKRPESANQTSKILQSSFVDKDTNHFTKYRITAFTQKASFSINPEGGVANSRTYVEIAKSIPEEFDKRPSELDLRDKPFCAMIRRSKVDNGVGVLHTIYSGFYSPYT
jgi:hypothetical protein